MIEDEPTALASLRDDAELNRELDLTWLSADEASAVRDDWLAVWNQVPFDDAFHDRCRQRLVRSRPVAFGPVRRRRLDRAESRLALVVDREAPEEIFASLSSAMPAVLWVASPLTSAGLRSSLAGYLDPSRPAAVALPGGFRAVKALDLETMDQLESAIRALELWVDDATWGSAFEDDPWPAVEGPMNMMQQTQMLRDAAQEDPDRFPSRGFRTLWSQSRLRVEQHPMGMWVFDLRYRPIDGRGEVAGLNDLLGLRLPEDLPVDLAASMLRGSILDERLLDELEHEGEAPLDRAAIRCGQDPGSMATEARLRRIVAEVNGDEPSLATLANLASRYRHDALLFDLWALSEGTDLGADLERFLSPAAQLPLDEATHD